jgi:DinB family protein
MDGTIVIATALTNEQIARATSYLAETGAALTESATGLSDEQWAFKPTPDCWSINGIVEHLVVIETTIQGIVVQMNEAPEAAADFSAEQMDEIIVTTVPVRSRKTKAPPYLQPAQRWSGPEAVEEFLKVREKTLQLLTPASLAGLSLRGRVRSHPIFGAWDGYHWILATAAHCARHTGQIHEIKATADFLRTCSPAAALQ